EAVRAAIQKAYCMCGHFGPWFPNDSSSTDPNFSLFSAVKGIAKRGNSTIDSVGRKWGYSTVNIGCGEGRRMGGDEWELPGARDTVRVSVGELSSDGYGAAGCEGSHINRSDRAECEILLVIGGDDSMMCW
ncbi:9170_t:CDS:2, partial [Acaulospora colombiana]